MVENKLLGKIKTGHTCSPDSALKCVDCNCQVCPKCFVQCAVGNRCKKCTERFTSHVLIVTPKILLKLFAASLVLGYAWGYVGPNLDFGYIGYFLIFFAAVFAGRLLHKIAGYKIGMRPVAVVLVGMAIGLALGPYQQEIMATLQMGQPINEQLVRPEQMEALRHIANARLTNDIVHIAIFMIGAVVPFMRKS